MNIDDADADLVNCNGDNFSFRIDDGDIRDGEYNLEAQDGTLSLNITGGGGEFDIRPDDAHVMTQGNFKTNEESESHTRVLLEKGKAIVTMRVGDARIKLASN